ncbi:MAG: phenylalanine--tRNA ligase subunit beta [Lentisphaerae bacterium]|nr:phenylalanine--tRNA ligase subunit beta [Lentisphaerota bacterium]
MNISYNWLKKYIDLSLTADELPAKLTMAGLEVEGIEKTGSIPEGVVTAKILSRNPHENSDHLSVCQVDKGDEVLQIVCGAPNCDAGNIVPLATIGTTFKDGEGTFTIKKGKLRGVESFGMMCSARELGLSNDHDGLLILPADTKIGVPFGELMDSDVVYDCSVTPNRPDWLSHIGVARDIAALLDTKLVMPEICNADAPVVPGLVTVNDPDLCPIYAARIIRGVKVGDSPEWMQKALSAVGIRPISNLVDITNYVMMEMGVPLHAFDIRNLSGEKIIVRRAAEGESIVALDGKKYDLTPENLCICDAEKPVAIAGVMGGEYSGIQADTTTVVLESAFFDPDSIRMTSRKLGLSSDASYRYERGVDRNAVLAAGRRALQLILEIAGGEYVGCCEVAAPAPEVRTIEADYSRIRGLLGLEVTDSDIEKILISLGFGMTAPGVFTVPSWRVYDVVGEADLAEEVARIYGLDKLPAVPIRAITDDFKLDGCHVIESLRNQLTGIGLDEIVCGSMIDEKSATADKMFTPEELIRPYNPISLDLGVMRPSLLPGILNTVRHNIARKNLDLALFEIGHVFCKNTEKFPEERDELSIAVTGRIHPERFSAERAVVADFYDLKGILESLLTARKVKNFQFRAAEDPRFLKGHCAEVLVNKRVAGVFGEVVPALTKGMRLSTPLFVAMIQLKELLTAEERTLLYDPISPFPSTSRDVAFIAPKELEHRIVVDFIQKAHLPNLERVELFDIFEGEAVGEGRKSMAYSLIFRSAERTLTDDEVNSSYEKLRQKLERGLGVELR